MASNPLGDVIGFSPYVGLPSPLTIAADGTFPLTHWANAGAGNLLPATVYITDASPDNIYIAGPLMISPIDCNLLTVSSASIPADNTTTSTVIAVPKDATTHQPIPFGDPSVTSVTFSTTAGHFPGGCTTNCAATQRPDGSWALALSSATTGVATITSSVNGTPVTLQNGAAVTAAVQFTQAGPPPPPPPATPVIASGPGTSTTSTSAAFTFTGDTNATGFLCSLDGAAFTSCVSGVQYTGLAVGSHTFQVEATGRSGTSASASSTWTITVPLAGCTRAGDVNGGINAKGGLQINVEGDCDAADKKHATAYIHHAHIHVEGLVPKIDGETNDDGKKGDIASISFSPDGTTATITGTLSGQAFTLTVTAGTKNPKTPGSYTFMYGGRTYSSAGLKTDGDLHIDLG